MANKIKVGITQGDTNGVGWEVILKSLADPRMAELITPVIYGSRSAADFYKKLSEGRNADGEIIKVDGVSLQTVASARQANPKGISIVDTDSGEATSIEPGKPTPASGAAAVKALREAVRELREGHIDVLVTAPVSKENSQSADWHFAGHTEYLASEFEGAPVMMMCSEALRVALVTSHIAIADVPGAITKGKILEKLRTLKKTLTADFGIVAPRIAVLALNPHAGENGMMGTDEAEVIKPAIVEAYAEGILAFGPVAADGLFLSGDYAKYDALLAMYHDQGLAPFKALTPDGVNFTAGLDIVRTSPDHGTAFDIAGKDMANPDSMRNAIYMAVDTVRNRRNYAEMSRNPLKHYEREKGDERTIDFSKSEI